MQMVIAFISLIVLIGIIALAVSVKRDEKRAAGKSAPKASSTGYQSASKTVSATKTSVKPSSAASFSGEGTLTALCTSDMANRVRFKNGEVYCLSKYGSDYLIGYYKREANYITVQCEFDRGEIGRVIEENRGRYSVYFSTEALYNRKRSKYLKIHQLATAYGFGKDGWIEDDDSHQRIAEFEGDAAQAAAAFVALAYEMLPHSRYHMFYRDGIL